MKSIKSKIKKVIQKSNGYPDFTRNEYLEHIRLHLNNQRLILKIKSDNV